MFPSGNKDRQDTPEKQEKRLREGQIVSTAATVLLVLALCLCFVAVLQTSRQGYVNLFGRSLFRVVTGSMEPTIPQGALLMSKNTPVTKLRVGDIVCYRSHQGDSEGLIITHRVVAIMQGEDGSLMLETKGDANSVPDRHFITQADLIGKVVWYTGSNGALSRFVAFLNGGIGYMALIAVPGFLISSGLLVRSIRNVRQELDSLNEALEREKNSQGAAPPISPEELEALRQEIWQELMAERQEIMRELLQEITQGEQHE